MKRQNFFQITNFITPILNRFVLKQKDFQINDVYSSNESFVTGTFAGIIPGIEIDGKPICDGKRGKMTHNIQALYRKKLDSLYPTTNTL